MDYSIIIIFVIWLPQAVLQFLLWLYWIQTKEYRLDRFRSFIYSGYGRKQLLVYLIAFKILLLIPVLLDQVLVVLTVLLMLVLNLYFSKRFKDRNLRRPIFTQRVIKMLPVPVVVFVLTIFAMVATTPAKALLFGEIAILLSPFMGVALTAPLVNKIKKEEAKKAIKKIEHLNLKVIGITGSYGKTTTKDILAEILAKKYKVDKTTKNENTVFGIIRKIIKDTDKGTEVFVAEMGAYRKGDIKELANIVKPEIGIITGIEPQHIDLFGSIENIKKAKFELIESLPKGGTAIFNLSNEDTRELYRRAVRELPELDIKGYILHKNVGKKYQGINIDLESRIVESDEKGVKFEVFENGNSVVLFAPVTGVHFIENITGSILVSRMMGLSWNQINKAVSKIKLPDKTMQVTKLGYGSILIDDSNNSTPNGFLSALNYLSYFKNKKRVVVTPGIIELGKQSRGIHKKIGSAIEKKCDHVIVTNEEHAKYIREGFLYNSEKLEVVENGVHLLGLIQSYIENGSVILLEGRVPSVVYKYLINRK